MNYSTFSTSALTKILDRSAEGSAEQEAVKKELRRREPLRPADKDTLKLFTAAEWQGTRDRQAVDTTASTTSTTRWKK